jgi:hypothetical protein
LEGTDHRLSLVTVTFAAEPGAVRVTIDHEGLPDYERAELHREGWSSILEKSARLLVSLTEGIDDHD